MFISKKVYHLFVSMSFYTLFRTHKSKNISSIISFHISILTYGNTEPLIRIANSVQPLTIISVVNKIINLSLRPIDLTLGFTCPTLFNFCLFLCISNINISVSFTIVADRFISHYKSLVYPPWHPCLGNKGSFFSFLFQLLLHNKSFHLNVSFYILVVYV